MPTLAPAAIYDLARGAGLSATAALTATAIALAESGGRTDAVGDQGLANGTWGPSVGLWQIRSLRADTGTGRARDVNRLTDPAFNARAMVEISGGGDNWRPWSVYTSGAYRTQMDRLLKGPGDYAADAAETVGETAGEVLAAVNPFDGWAGGLQDVAVKVAVSGAALALLIVGLTRAVQR